MAEYKLASTSEHSRIFQKFYDEPKLVGVRARVFTRNYPLIGFPEKITLKIDANVTVINGVYGDKPTTADIHAQSDLLALKWGERDGGLVAPDYDIRLVARHGIFHTSAFSACHNGRPCALILPRQINGRPENSADIANEKKWDLDDPGGDTLDVRKFVSEKAGLAQMLLDAYLAYGKVLFDAGIIKRVVAYTRPANLKGWREEHPEFRNMPKLDLMKAVYIDLAEDRNIMLHVSRGARVGEIYPDGCPKDNLAQGVMIEMDYTHQMMNLKV